MAPIALVRTSAVPRSVPISIKRCASIVTKPGLWVVHPSKASPSQAATSATATRQSQPSASASAKARVYANQLPAELQFVLFQSQSLSLDSLDSLLSRAQASPAAATGMRNRFLEKQRSTGPTELCLSKAFRPVASSGHSAESAQPHCHANDGGLRDLVQLVEQSQKTVQVLRHVLERQRAENQALRHQLQGSASTSAAGKATEAPKVARSSSRTSSDASPAPSSPLPTVPERCRPQQPSSGSSSAMAAASPVEGGSFAPPMPSQPRRRGHTLSSSSSSSKPSSTPYRAFTLPAKSLLYTLKPLDAHPLARRPHRHSQDPSSPQLPSSTALSWWQWCKVGGLTTLTGWAVLEPEALWDLAAISSTLVGL
ncbi:hypothetical protein H4R35_001623 [Dimargaris xerosporica]|nr:hypothetical protein H4R35_001623 [Dimargaris xerosporica]